MIPIAEGRTNRNFRVTVGEEAFFLRLSEKSTELLGIDRTAEQDSARAAAEAGVGPEVFVYLPELGCLVTRWIDADPLTEGDLEREEILRAVVEAIKKIHAGPALRWAFDPFRIVEDYRGSPRSAASSCPMPSMVRTRRPPGSKPRSRANRCPSDRATTTCWRRTSCSRDGHVWIVDHEYAGMGDPFFDLGNLSINNALSDDAQERLLGLYFGEPTDAHRARLKLMRIMSDFREAMWGVVQQGLSTLDIDYVEYASHHFDRLSTTMADPRFDDWLETAQGN